MSINILNVYSILSSANSILEIMKYVIFSYCFCFFQKYYKNIKWINQLTDYFQAGTSFSSCVELRFLAVSINRGKFATLYGKVYCLSWVELSWEASWTGLKKFWWFLVINHLVGEIFSIAVISVPLKRHQRSKGILWATLFVKYDSKYLVVEGIWELNFLLIEQNDT